MKRILVVLAAAVALSTIGLAWLSVADPQNAAAARLRNFVKTDTEPQSGDTDVDANGANINATNDPFSYSNVQRIRRIERVTITATIDDGDTGPGDQDEGDLTLALDGIDTGIALNGFRNQQTDTQTITGEPNNAGQIKDALKADGKLQASIIDHDPVEPGFDNEVSLPSNFDTTLTIKGKRVRG